MPTGDYYPTGMTTVPPRFSVSTNVSYWCGRHGSNGGAPCALCFPSKPVSVLTDDDVDRIARRVVELMRGAVGA